MTNGTGFLGGFGSSVYRQLVTQAGSSALLSCIYVFDKDYDTYPSPYVPPVEENSYLRVDSTFLPDPPQGWFGLGNSSLDVPFIALDYFQTAPWFHLAIDPAARESDVQNLGSRTRAMPVETPLSFLSGFNGSNATALNNPSTFNSSLSVQNTVFNLTSTKESIKTWDGLLGSFTLSLFMNISVNQSQFPQFSQNLSASFVSSLNLSDIANFIDLGINLDAVQPLPWFDNASSAVADDDLDNQIAADITATLDELNSSLGFDLSYRSGSIYSFPGVANSIQGVSNMPWGNVRFSEAKNGSYAYLFQAGMDARLSNIVSYPSEGLRRMALQTMLMKAACNSFLQNRLTVSETKWISSHDCASVPSYASTYQPSFTYTHQSFECEGLVSIWHIFFHSSVRLCLDC